ncbi:MAG: hypothetical protein H6Q89_2538 [Myxococcaceae bacterium]|nr:hypothetical protein [Myxococcaceae bacterium]
MNESDVTQLIDAGLLARRLIRRAEYDAILKFINGSEPMRLVVKMRLAGRAQLVLTPLHRIPPGQDTLELRISAHDGGITGHRRSQSISGHAGTPIVDRESLEATVPPEAAVTFARALEGPQLWETVNGHLAEKPGPPVAD